MFAFAPTAVFLAHADRRQAVFLPLILAILLFSTLCHADTYPYTAEQRQQLSDVENYVRKQSLHGLTLLPAELRGAAGFFSGNWRSLSLDGDDDAAAAPAPTAATEDPAASNGGLPINLASNFHHKGFLPTHDAMVMGLGVTQPVAQNKMQLTARPFYGQNWRSAQGYWGGELALNIDRHPDGLPWGKIALGYTGGNDALTDSGRGVDLHGDVDLTGGWQFTSGIKQNSLTGDSNYLMLRWKLEFK